MRAGRLEGGGRGEEEGKEGGVGERGSGREEKGEEGERRYIGGQKEGTHELVHDYKICCYCRCAEYSTLNSKFLATCTCGYTSGDTQHTYTHQPHLLVLGLHGLVLGQQLFPLC